MGHSPSLHRSPIAGRLSRNMPHGAGFVIAGAVSVVFWAVIAGIAAIA